jgi:hypothetical protein
MQYHPAQIKRPTMVDIRHDLSIILHLHRKPPSSPDTPWSTPRWSRADASDEMSCFRSVRPTRRHRSVDAELAAAQNRRMDAIKRVAKAPSQQTPTDLQGDQPSVR